MPKHKLSPYRVKLRQGHVTGKKVRTQDLWKLNDLGSMNGGLREYDNFIELLEDFFQHLADVGHLNDTVKRTLNAIQFESGVGDFDSKAEARTLEAELSYGRYNRVADHNDKDVFGDSSRESPADHRRPNQRDRDTVAETRLHFLSHLPTNTNRSAFFVLHSYGRNSVKTRLRDALNRFILDKYDSNAANFAMKADRRKDSFKLEMNTVAGSDLIDELKSSKIVGFEVQKRDTNVPEYMSEGSVLGNDAEGTLKIEYTSDDILSDINMKKENLGELIRNEDYPLAELVDDDPSRVNALVETSSPGRPRRVNITRDEIRMEAIIDSADIEYDDEGRVKISTVGDLSREFLNEKLQDIGARSLREESLLR